MHLSATPLRLRRLLLGTSALTGFALASTAQAGQAALPTNGVVTVGSATIAQPNANQLNITTATSRTVIDWQSFSIGNGNKVAIQQPGSSSITVNEVTGSDPSQIFGDLSSNGRVVLANPNGIWFGPNSHVDVAGLVASTATLSADAKKAFAAGGRLSLDTAGNPTASIQNDGHITIASEGLAALVAPGVRNNGVIEATLGSVTLASGETSTLDFYGDGLVSLAVTSPVQALAIGPDGKPFQAMIENKGKIAAQHVLVTADVVKGVVDNSINMSGVVEAKGVTVSGGDIVLDGGEGAVTVAGTLDATSQQAQGGNIAVTGGAVTLAATAKLDASGAKGGGTIQVGGGPHGSGNLKHAASVLVQGGSAILANATVQGNGGTVSVWSDGLTTFDGSIQARGAGMGGNGGWVETSSEGRLSVGLGAMVDTLAPHGTVGTWLLDPNTIVVATGGSDTLTTGANTSDTTSNITIAPATIDAAASNVVLSATTSITVNNDISITNSGVGITFEGAGGSVASGPSSGTTLNANITTNNGAVQINGTLIVGANATINTGTAALSTGPIEDSAAYTHSLTLLSGNVTLGTVGDQSPLGSLFVAGSDILVGGIIATGSGQTFAGPVLLTANTTFSNNVGVVLFKDTLDGPFCPTFPNSTPTVEFDKPVGSKVPLAGVYDYATVTNFGGSTTNPITFTANGNEEWHGGGIVLFQDSVIRSDNGSLFFTGTIDSSGGIPRSLVLASSNYIEQYAAIGSVHPLDNLTFLFVNGHQSGSLSGNVTGITTDINPSQNTFSGVVNFDSIVPGHPITLVGDTTITAANEGIFLSGPIDGTGAGAQMLTLLDPGNTVAINGAIGGTTNLAGLTITAGVIMINSAVVNAKAQRFNGPVILGTSATLSAAGPVNFTSTIEATTSGTESLTISDASGPVTFGGAIGGGTELGSLSVTGQAISLGATITLADVPTFDGPVTLLGDTTITSTGTSANVSGAHFAGTVNGAHALTINTPLGDGGTVTFEQTVGGVIPLAALAVTADTVILGVANGPDKLLIVTGGDQSYSTAGIQLLQDTVLRSQAGNLSLATANFQVNGGSIVLSASQNLNLSGTTATGTFANVTLVSDSLTGSPTFTHTGTLTTITTMGTAQQLSGAVDYDLLRPGGGVTLTGNTTITATGESMNLTGPIEGTTAGAQMLMLSDPGFDIAINAAIGVNRPLGTLTINSSGDGVSTGVVTQAALASINATNLELTGSGAVFDLTSTVNNVGTLAANAGSVTLNNGGNVLTIGTAGSTAGIALSGDLALSGIGSTLTLYQNVAVGGPGGVDFTQATTGAAQLLIGQNNLMIDTSSGTGPINLGAINGPVNLQLNASSGTISLGGAIGGSVQPYGVNETSNAGIIIGANITTLHGDQFFGPVRLATDATVILSDDMQYGLVHFSSTVDGAHALTVNAQATGSAIVQFDATVGGTTPLTSLNVTGPAVQIGNGGAKTFITTTGNQTFITSEILLTQDAVIRSQGGSVSLPNLSFVPNGDTESIVLSASTNLNVSGDTTGTFVNATIVSDTLTGSPTFSHSGTFTMITTMGTAQQLTGSVDYDMLRPGGNVTLSGNTTITATGENMDLTGQIDGTTAGAQMLTLSDPGRNIAINAPIGANRPLGSLTINATGDGVTTGLVTQGPFDYIDTTALELTGTGASFALTSTFNNVGTLAANTGSVTLNNGGNVLTIGTAGATTGVTLSGNLALAGLGATLTLDDNVTVSGPGGVDFTETTTGAADVVIAQQNITIDTSGGTGPINLGAVDGMVALTLNTGTSVSSGTISLGGTIGAGTAPYVLVATSGAGIILGADITTQTGMNFYGPATLAADVTLTTTQANNVVHFASTLDGAHALTVNIDQSGFAELHFDQSVGSRIPLTSINATESTVFLAEAGAPAAITTTGDLTFNAGGFVLGNDVLMRSQAGSISITNASFLPNNGIHNLTLSASANLDLTNTTGTLANVTLVSDTLTGNPTFMQSGTLTTITTNGTPQQFSGLVDYDMIRPGGAVTLTADTTITASGEIMNLTGPIDGIAPGAQVLTLSDPGFNIAIGAPLGGGTPLKSLSVTALGVSLGLGTGNTSITTQYDQHFAVSGIALYHDALLRAQAGNISLANVSLNPNGNSILLSAAAAVDFSNVTNSGTFNNVTLVSDSLVGSPSFPHNGTVTTITTMGTAQQFSGPVDYDFIRPGGTVTLTGDTTITATGENMNLSGPIDGTSIGAQMLTLSDPGFNIAINAPIGGTTPLGTLTIHASGDGMTTGLVSETAPIDAGYLELLGTNGVFNLNSASNNIGTLAANTGAVYLNNGGNPLTIGTAGGTVGITLSNSLSLTNVGTVTLAANIQAGGAGGVDLSAAPEVLLAQNVTIDTSNGTGPILLPATDAIGAGTAAQTLTLTSGSTVTLLGDIGDLGPLGGLSVTGSAIYIGGSGPFMITSTGEQDFMGNVTLTQSGTLTSTMGSLHFFNKLDGAVDVTLSAADTVYFDDDAGSQMPFNSLTVNGTFSPYINTTTTGNQTYNDETILWQDSHFTSTNSGSIHFGGLVDTSGASEAFTVSTGGIVSFDSGLGTNSVPLTSVDITAATINMAHYVYTSGDQTYTGPARLAADVNAISTNGNITFTSTIDNTQALTISAANGSVTIGGKVGSQNALYSFTLNAETLNGSDFYNGSSPSITVNNGPPSVTLTGPGPSLTGVLNSGTYSYGSTLVLYGTITLGTDVTITVTGGGIDVTGRVDGSHRLTLLDSATGATLRLLGAIGSSTPLTGLTLSNAGTIVLGSTITTTGGQSFGAPVTLTNAATLTATGTAAIQFASTIDGGSQTLTIANAAGSVLFGGDIGDDGALSTVSVTAASITLPGNVTTFGGQTYAGAVTLAAASTDLTALSGVIVFGGAVNGLTGTENLTLGAGEGSGTFTFEGAVGTGAGLGALDLQASGGPITLGADVKTSGGQIYAGAVTVAGANVTLTDTGAAGIGFADAVNGTIGTENLTINAVGPVSFNANVGGTVSLGSLAVAAGSIILPGSVITTGGQSFAGATALYTDTTLTAGGTIGLSGTVDGTGTQSLTLVGGAVTLSGVIGGTPSGAATLLQFTDGAATVLTGDTTIHTAGSILITGSVNGAHALALDDGAQMPATVTITGGIGTTTALASLAVVANDGITVGGAINTTGDQSYNAAVTLVADTTFSAATGGIGFGSTIDGAHALSVAAGGPVSFGGAIGSIIPVSSFALAAGSLPNGLPSVASTGSVAINPGTATLSGDYSFTSFTDTGALTLAGDTAITTTGSLSLGGTVDGAHALTLGAGTVASLTGTVGGATALTSLTVMGTGGITLAGAVTTAGTQTYGNAVTLVGAATLGTPGAIAFDGTIDGPFALAVSAGSTVSAASAIGGAAVLASLSVTAGSSSLGSVTTAGGQTYNGAVQFQGPATITATNFGMLHFAGTVGETGSGALTVSTGGGVAFDAAITAATLAVTGGTISVGSVTTTGSQSYTGTTTLVGTALSGGAFTVTGMTVLGGSETITAASGITFAGPLVDLNPRSGTLTLNAGGSDIAFNGLVGNSSMIGGALGAVVINSARNIIGPSINSTSLANGTPEFIATSFTAGSVGTPLTGSVTLAGGLSTILPDNQATVTTAGSVFIDAAGAIAIGTLNTTNAGADLILSARGADIVNTASSTTGAQVGNGGTVTLIGSSLTLAGVSAGGGTSRSNSLAGSVGGNGGSIMLDATNGDITILGGASDVGLTVAGGASQLASGGAGGAGGTISVTASGALVLSNAIAVGGDVLSGTGGAGGTITLDGSTIALLRATARGGDSQATGSGAGGGAGGAVTLIATGTAANEILITGNSSDFGGGATALTYNTLAARGGETGVDATDQGGTLAGAGGSILIEGSASGGTLGGAVELVNGAASGVTPSSAGFAAGANVLISASGVAGSGGSIRILGSIEAADQTVESLRLGAANGTVTVTGDIGSASGNALAELVLSGNGGAITVGGGIAAGTIAEQRMSGSLTVGGDLSVLAYTSPLGNNVLLSFPGLTGGGSVDLGGTFMLAGAGAFGTTAVTLTGTTVIDTSTNNSALSLGSVDGAFDLTVLAGTGAVSINAIGGTTALGSVTIDAGTANLGSVTTTGAQTYVAATTLGGNYSGSALAVTGPTLLSTDTVVSTGAGGTRFGGTVDGGQALTLNDASGSVTLAGAAGSVTPLGSLTINAANISVGSVVTTHAQVFNGATQFDGTYSGNSFSASGSDILMGSTSVTATAGNLGFAGTVDGGQALTLSDTGGTVTLGGAIGSTAALGSLNVTGTAITANSVTTTGGQTYTGAATLSGNFTAGSFTANGADTLAGATSVTATSGNVAFGGSIDGAQSLTLAATSGSVTVAGAVGGKTALSSLTLGGASDAVTFTGSVATAALTDTRSSGSLTVAGGLTAASYVASSNNDVLISISGGTGPLSLAGEFDFTTALDLSGRALTLTGATVLDTSANNKSLTLGTVDGAYALTLNAGTAAVALKGAAGAQTALASLTINGGTISLGNVTTTGAQSYNGATTFNGTYIGSSFSANGTDLLGGATGVTATAGNISFSNTIDGGQVLSLTDVSGIVTLGGTVGGKTDLGSLTITAAGIVASNVTTTGAQSYGGALTLASSSTIQSVNSDLTFGSTINGTQSLILSAGGNIVFDGTLASQANPTALSVLTADNVTVLNNSTLWVTTFKGFATGTFTFGNHSLESDDVVTIQASSVDGRVVSSSATLNVNTATGIITGDTVSVTATGAVSEQITAGAASVNSASFDGSIAATRSANISASGDVSGTVTVSGGSATVSGANVSGSVTASGLAQISATANVSADVTGGAVTINAGGMVSGAVTSTGSGGVSISAANVSSTIVAQNNGSVDVTASGSITGSVTGGAVTLTAPVVNENITAAAATVNSPNQTLTGTIGGTDVGAFANNVTQEVLGATQQVASNSAGGGTAGTDDGGDGQQADGETDDDKKKKKKDQGAVYDYANQYIDNLITGKPAH